MFGHFVNLTISGKFTTFSKRDKLTKLSFKLVVMSLDWSEVVTQFGLHCKGTLKLFRLKYH